MTPHPNPQPATDAPSNRAASTDRRLRICIVNSFYPPYIPGGAEISVSELARELNRDHEVLVICSNTENRRTEERIDGVRVIRIPSMNPFFFGKKPRGVWQKTLWHTLRPLRLLRPCAIKKAVLDFKPDIVHMHNLLSLWPRLPAWLGRKKIPSLHTARDLAPLCSRMMIRGERLCETQCLKCKIRNYPKRLALLKVDASVGISNAIAEKYINAGYYRPLQTRIIYNSVPDMGNLPPPPADAYDAGFIGGFSQKKGILLLLEIARLRPSYRFCVATQSPPEVIEKFRDKIPPNVTILGRVSQPVFFSQIKICLVPSLVQEAFGRVAAESLSACRPAIVSDRGGLPEIVRDGIDGYSLPPDNPERWALALDSLLQNATLYRSMAGAARQRYLENFTCEQVRDNYTRLYREVLSRKI